MKHSPASALRARICEGLALLPLRVLGGGVLAVPAAPYRTQHSDPIMLLDTLTI